MISRLFAFLIVLCLPVPAMAQDFTPQITVNGEGITGYELKQRRLLLEAIGVPGDIDEQAETGLIEDRLKRQAARGLGLEITPDALNDGLASFAQRGNLEADEFLLFLNENGVSQQTIRDFIEAGMLWRELVRGRFGARATVSESEIERALALSGTQSGARILLAEIILPANTPEVEAQTTALAEDLSQRIRTNAQFAEAARRFSIAPSRERGGRRDWVNLSTLPPQLASVFLTLTPGEVTDPIRINQDAIGLFQVRAFEERRAEAPGGASIEYATLALPADPSTAAAQAAEIRQRVDTCDDLYTVARGLPEGALNRQTLPTGQLPGPVASAVRDLDPNETALLSGSGAPRLLMLCARVSAELQEAEEGTEQIRSQLRNQRISSYADSYLEELRADAEITR